MGEKKKGSKWILKDMQSYSVTQAKYWTDYRCRIPHNADFKEKGTKTVTQSSLGFRGTRPSETNISSYTL